MHNTKEKILLAALDLFAQDGYQAVSVSQIAGKLGITKGALYRHYQNKRDIFDHILSRMAQQDARQAADFSLPEGTVSQMPDAYRQSSLSQLVAFSYAQLLYWTQDDFAAPFRRLLTLEQYRDTEMARLYQQYLSSGPAGYVTDLLQALGYDQPAQRALAFYGPMLLLMSLHDGGQDIIPLAQDYFRGAYQLLWEARPCK